MGLRTTKITRVNENAKIQRKWAEKVLADPDKKLGSMGRKWQVDAFNLCKKERFTRIQAACGSGKSMVQTALGIFDIESSKYKQKQLFTVPQSHIGSSFAGEEEMTIRVCGKKYQWYISDALNFTDPDRPEKIKDLVAWLLAPASNLRSVAQKNSLEGLVAVCSHKALVMAFDKIKQKERGRALKNLTIRVDEVHHLQNVYEGDDDPVEETNRLTEVIRQVLRQPSKTNSKLCFTTATFFRGDGRPIINSGLENKFVSYSQPWLTHWNSLGIDSLEIGYEEYTTSPVDNIIKIIKKYKKRKFLVIVPPKGHKWRKGGDKELHRLANELHKIGKVCDLVTRKGWPINKQKKNKAELLKEPKDGSKSQFDIVFSCNLVREGTDWVPCDFVLNAAAESSPTVAVQTMGRPFRMCPSKSRVDVITFVPDFNPKRQDKREFLSDRTNLLLGLTGWHDMIYPLYVRLSKMHEDSDEEEKAKGREKKQTLADLYGQDYHNFERELIESYGKLPKEERNGKGADILLDSLLDKYGLRGGDKKSVTGAWKAKLARLLLGGKSPSINHPFDAKYIRKKGGFDAVVKTGESVYGSVLNKSRLAEFEKVIINVTRDMLLKRRWKSPWERE